MKFRLRSDGRVVSARDIRELNPNVLFPEFFTPDTYDAFGFDPVFPTPMPATDMSSFAAVDGCEKDALGNWVDKWKILQKLPEDLQKSFQERQASVLRDIDSSTDEILKACIGERLAEYQRAEAEARAFKAADYKGEVGALVSDWALIKGWTNEQSANDIIAQADAWIQAQAAIRKNRLQAKESARLATNIPEVEAAWAAWCGFDSYIRNALGV